MTCKCIVQIHARAHPSMIMANRNARSALYLHVCVCVLPAALVLAMRLATTALAVTLALQRVLPRELHLGLLSGWAVLLPTGVFVAFLLQIGATHGLVAGTASHAQLPAKLLLTSEAVVHFRRRSSNCHRLLHVSLPEMCSPFEHNSASHHCVRCNQSHERTGK